MDPGTMVGRYRIEAKLGEGGGGEVWKAFDPELQRWVALKFLKGQEPDELARFLSEARIAARLQHPHIGAIYEAQSGWIAMQFIAGVTLDKMPGGDYRALASALRQAAVAVHHAHEQGIIHRDLKPANIMVVGGERSPHAFVMDFGLAKAAGVERSLTMSGMMVGTPAYMSPEQARGETRTVDARSDVYGLGATLYSVLAGRPPAQGTSLVEIVMSVIQEDPRPVRALAPGVPAELETIAMKALEKDPARRYRTAAEFADELGRWLAGEPILARPPSVAARVSRGLARRKPLVAGVAVALAAFAGVGIWWTATAEQRALAESRRREDEIFGPIKARLPDLSSNRAGWRRGIELLDAGLARFEPSWEAWMLKGERHARLGEADLALAAYGRAAELNPRLAQARFRRGRVFLLAHRNEEARAEYDRAIALEPDNELAMAGRATVAYLEKDFRRAIELCDQAERGGRTFAEIQFARAWVLSLATNPDRDPAEALKAIDRAIGLDPDDFSSYDLRSMLRYEQGNVEGALEDCERSFALNPENAMALGNRAAVLVKKGDYAKAIETCDRAIALEPRQTSAYLARGVARYSLGDYAGAAADYSRIVEIDPDHTAAWSNRGNAKKRLGQHAGALADYDESLRRAPRQPDVLVSRGWVREAMGDGEGALDDYGRCLEIAPRDTEALFNRGNLLQKRSRAEEAIADYDRCLAIDPGHTGALLNRAAAFAAIDPKRGIEEFTKVIAAHPVLRSAHYNRGQLRMETGDAAGAIADFTAEIGIDPGNPNPWLNRGSLKGRGGDDAAALADYEMALKVAPKEWAYRAELTRLVERLKRR